MKSGATAVHEKVTVSISLGSKRDIRWGRQKVLLSASKYKQLLQTAPLFIPHLLEQQHIIVKHRGKLYYRQTWGQRIAMNPVVASY